MRPLPSQPNRSSCPLRQALCEAYRSARPRILGRLRRRFSSTPPEQREDALNQGLLSLLETTDQPNAAAARIWRADGAGGLERLLSTAAWRALRGEHRLLRSRRERCRQALPDLGHGEDPLSLLELRRTAARMERLLPAAARRFGPARTRALQVALEDRLGSGDTDLAVADRHGLGRTQICRARGWLEAELLG